MMIGLILSSWRTHGTLVQKGKLFGVPFVVCKYLFLLELRWYTPHDSNMRPLDS